MSHTNGSASHQIDNVMHEIDQVILFSNNNNNNNNKYLSNEYCSSNDTHSSHSSASHSPYHGSIGMPMSNKNMSYNSLSSLNSQYSYYSNGVTSQINDVDRLLMSSQQSLHQQQGQYPSMPQYHGYQSPFGCMNKMVTQQMQLPPIPLQSESKQNNNNVITATIAHKTGTEIDQFQAENAGKLQLKDYVFISKDCTYRLGQYVVKEYWGREYSLLYKYLDYIFRCQTFSKQIIKLKHYKNGQKASEFLVFHSGLQRRSDNQFLYVLLITNSISKQQSWRVQFGGIHNSFMSKNELMKKLKEAGITISDQYLPQRTRFCMNLSDLLYDEMYSVQVNWEDRLTTNQDRIHKVMGHSAFFDDRNKFLRMTELISAFEDALRRTELMAAMNPRIAVPQGFVDTKHGKYRMELLLPLAVKYPKGQNGKYYRFALAINKSEKHRKQYIVKSILTLEMAYANARLIGYVDSLWLCSKDHHDNNNKNHANTDINQWSINP